MHAAWNHLTREQLAASFKTCGITTALDGSEDHLINCLKPDGEMSEGLETLQQDRLGNDDIELIECTVGQLNVGYNDSQESDHESDASLELMEMSEPQPSTSTG